MHHLTYDYHTYRRCAACRPIGGRYPLRAIIEVGTDVRIVDDDGREVDRVVTDSVRLECGHLDLSHAEFVAANTRSESW